MGCIKRTVNGCNIPKQVRDDGKLGFSQRHKAHKGVMRLTPAQRLEKLVAFMRALDELRRGRQS